MCVLLQKGQLCQPGLPMQEDMAAASASRAAASVWLVCARTGQSSMPAPEASCRLDHAPATGCQSWRPVDQRRCPLDQTAPPCWLSHMSAGKTVTRQTSFLTEGRANGCVAPCTLSRRMSRRLFLWIALKENRSSCSN